MRIPITGAGDSAAWTLIDDEDFSLLPHSLKLDRKGTVVGRVYEGRRVNGHSRFREVRIPRLILGVDGDSSVEVDHINRDPLDNRRANLRLVPSRGANAQNVRSHRDATSRYRGVSWDRTKRKWKARVWLNGRNVSLGSFDDEAEAGRTAREYRLEHMPFAID